MIATVEFKKSIVDTYILGIIIGKLDHKQELRLITLFLINKSIKINLYHLILLLYLIINLYIYKGNYNI